VSVSSNVGLTFYSLLGSEQSAGNHHSSSLLKNPYISYAKCMSNYLSSVHLNRKMEHLTSSC
ncbi:hypothetical protein MUK42_12074, partial [Musa troglodytarum]